jgi:hypothetical protein
MLVVTGAAFRSILWKVRSLALPSRTMTTRTRIPVPGTPGEAVNQGGIAGSAKSCHSGQR